MRNRLFSRRLYLVWPDAKSTYFHLGNNFYNPLSPHRAPCPDPPRLVSPLRPPRGFTKSAVEPNAQARLLPLRRRTLAPRPSYWEGSPSTWKGNHRQSERRHPILPRQPLPRVLPRLHSRAQNSSGKERSSSGAPLAQAKAVTVDRIFFLR